MSQEIEKILKLLNTIPFEYRVRHVWGIDIYYLYTECGGHFIEVRNNVVTIFKHAKDNAKIVSRTIDASIQEFYDNTIHKLQENKTKETNKYFLNTLEEICQKKYQK